MYSRSEGRSVATMQEGMNGVINVRGNKEREEQISGGGRVVMQEKKSSRKYRRDGHDASVEAVQQARRAKMVTGNNKGM